MKVVGGRMCSKEKLSLTFRVSARSVCIIVIRSV